MSRDGNFAFGIHHAAQSAISKQQWLTGFQILCKVLIVLIVYQLAYYLYPVANIVRHSVNSGEMIMPATPVA